MGIDTSAHLIYGYSTDKTPIELIKLFADKLNIDIENQDIEEWWSYTDFQSEDEECDDFWGKVYDKLDGTKCDFYEHIINDEHIAIVLSAYEQGTFNFCSPEEIILPKDKIALNKNLLKASKAIGWPKSKPAFYLATTFS